ncbi:MAG: nucleoside monophosphate kinase, partial [Rickettsiales bacterium]|nr:nucleoside monophosphate kinase [Rickettsiales bacterium]
MNKLLIAVDGPGASGKGTLCQKLSKHFKIPYLNTGGLYRATTRKSIENNIQTDDIESLVKIAQSLTVDDINNPNNFTEEIGMKTPNIAKIREIRNALLQYQINFADKPNGAILDGR